MPNVRHDGGKQRYYDDVEAGRVKYASNLLPREEDA